MVTPNHMSGDDKKLLVDGVFGTLDARSSLASSALVIAIVQPPLDRSTIMLIGVFPDVVHQGGFRVGDQHLSQGKLHPVGIVGCLQVLSQRQSGAFQPGTRRIRRR